MSGTLQALFNFFSAILMINPLAIQNLLNQDEPIPAPSRAMPSIPISMLLNSHGSEPNHCAAPSIPISALLNPLPNGQLSIPARESIGHQHPEPQPVNDSIQRTLLHTEYKLNRQTMLSQVYRYPPNAVLEYPETGAAANELVGHLFEIAADMWDGSPARDFAYSRGEPRGYERLPSTCSLLVDSQTGEMVPCQVKHSTCQGIKICPFYDIDEDGEHHSSATRDQLRMHMHHNKEQQIEFTSPQRDVFEKTSAYLTGIIRIGCTSQSNEAYLPPAADLEERTALRRGYPEMSNRCTGRLIFQLNFEGSPYIKCEHHSRLNRDHFFDNTIGNGQFNTEYLEAVLTEDNEEIERIELEAQLEGYGPRMTCRTAFNHSAQRLTCHKTPRLVKLELNMLFEKLEVDLADMTPRKFMRHPILQSYLSTRYPMLRNPILSDLHISLSNCSHLNVYIERAKKAHFPEGTGWEGLLHIKRQQDRLLEPTDQYLCVMLEIPDTEVDQDEDDVPGDQALSSEAKPLRIVICMTSAASKRLVDAQYLQSDIGFKRIVGFYEFEIASLDRHSNTSFTFCRVFLTRQTAEAHRIVLKEIEKILIADTGRGLRFRHIHGLNANDCEGLILNWVVDQHRGQEKGIGLYVQDLARSVPQKLDFHEQRRFIQDLDPYEHLHRFLTLCTTHLYRKIRNRAVSEEVKSAMRSLICVTHEDWEGTLELIRTQGGQEGKSWVLDKESSKFAFAGMCWEKSFIPLSIWKARLRESNVVEVVHANVNMEGKKCTLVGGWYKGRHYDLMKQRFLVNREDFGIRESYSTKHPYENAMKNAKRKCKCHPEDAKIEGHNTRLMALHEKWVNAYSQLKHYFQLLHPSTGSSDYIPPQTAVAAYEKTRKQEEKAQKAYRMQVKVGKALGGTGSGKVLLVLPAQ
ncbi:hypothetical protein BT96DRAFT_984669 [Gymnopus androsaceus JB14]|uniref:Uncharacterized protein n=1 Tax=Gymnopus androsaceus JB14 TaxID=1447944 RepID=A0A6A4IBT4_9AGAR|nr:hypothetical protein BT96DRAFT_984669 [Gymnopus androsaceus JB14]